MTLRELGEKDVIQLKSGENLGRIDDMSFNPDAARIDAVILRGRRRLFGLLGRGEDVVIPCAAGFCKVLGRPANRGGVLFFIRPSHKENSGFFAGMCYNQT